MTAVDREPIFVATLKTGHYTFQAFGGSDYEARFTLSQAWRRHVEQTGADPDYLKDFRDDINVTEAAFGSATRDGDVFLSTDMRPTLERIIALANDESKGQPVAIPGPDWDGEGDPGAFSYDDVCRMLLGVGVFAYPEQTGGGTGTIYAGPLEKHTVQWGEDSEPETYWRHKVAAGPGSYGWGQRDTTGSITEFWMGLNDDEGNDGAYAADLAATNTRQLAAYIALWVIDAADFDNVTAIGLDATQRGIPQNGA